MNKKQLITMWCGIIVIVLMGLFPPWIALRPRPIRKYDFIFKGLYFQYPTPPPPSPELIEQYEAFFRKSQIDYIDHIDFTFLIIQWFVVSVITGGLIVTFRYRKPKEEQDQ